MNYQVTYYEPEQKTQTTKQFATYKEALAFYSTVHTEKWLEKVGEKTYAVFHKLAGGK